MYGDYFLYTHIIKLIIIHQHDIGAKPGASINLISWFAA